MAGELPICASPVAFLYKIAVPAVPAKDTFTVVIVKIETRILCPLHLRVLELGSPIAQEWLGSRYTPISLPSSRPYP